MSNFPKNMAEVRECLSRIKAWAAIAGVCAAVLLAFYGLQGYQYWDAWKESRDMTVEIDRITRKLDRGLPDAERTAQDLEIQQMKSAYLHSTFDYPDAARLIGLVSTTSWDTGVDLPAISAGDPGFKDFNGMRYRTQAVTVTARGPVQSVYQFLATLHNKVRVVSVPNISISNPTEDDAATQVQLVFYLSPQPISDEEGAD